MYYDEAWLDQTYGVAPSWQGTDDQRKHEIERNCTGWLEDIVWPDGPQCHNGHFDVAPARLTASGTGWRCRHCRHRFKVTQALKVQVTRTPHATETIAPMARSHVLVQKWFRAIYLLEKEPEMSWSELARHIAVTAPYAKMVGTAIGQIRDSDPELLALVVAGRKAGTSTLEKRKRRIRRQRR